MNRLGMFVVGIVFAMTALSQGPQMQGPLSLVPPGPPYDAAKHVNPILTYVVSKDFKTATYKEAQEAANVSLLNLSKDTGVRQSIELADPATSSQKDMKLPVKATFYPVVRQTFKLKDGGTLVLCSFKAPKITGTENGGGGLSIGGLPGRRGNDAKNKRFGTAGAPEELEVRGRRGLMFDIDGELTLSWHEDGVVHTATAKLPLKAFFQVLDDLL